MQYVAFRNSTNFFTQHKIQSFLHTFINMAYLNPNH